MVVCALVGESEREGGREERERFTVYLSGSGLVYVIMIGENDKDEE